MSRAKARSSKLTIKKAVTKTEERDNNQLPMIFSEAWDSLYEDKDLSCI